MRANNVLAHLLLVAFVIVLAGCSSVAASVAGGTLLGVGAHAVDDTSHTILALPLDRTEVLTRKTLAALDIDIADVDRKKLEGTGTKCRFEAGLLGDGMISVDVILERLSSTLTRVTVTASRGALKPDLETAEKILTRIVRAANEYSARQRLNSAVPLSPL